MTIQLLLGDCLDELPKLEANSVDAIVTDPPYGLGFMGQHWDHGVPGPDFWRECLRVLKPGGHLLAFAGTRTQHRMASNIEDSGFDIRDTIGWIYGSGFPKSHNLGGDWQGWGTALKPALEPITVARKPLIGTVADNVLQHGTGAINIDGCRVDGPGGVKWESPRGGIWATDAEATSKLVDNPLGRWPANLIHDGSEEVVALFPDSNGSGGSLPNVKITGYGDGIGNGKSEYFGGERTPHNSGKGSAARFFYCAKASRKDRNEGCEEMQKKPLNWSSGTQNPGSFQSEGTDKSAHNHHPTVKPTDLMRYLCRLVTPPGGIVLDPFMGSGSTGKAALQEGFRFIGIEREADYYMIAWNRIMDTFEKVRSQ